MTTTAAAVDHEIVARCALWDAVWRICCGHASAHSDPAVFPFGAPLRHGPAKGASPSTCRRTGPAARDASAAPVAFHVALTESSAQVSLRDASLTPPEALHTGQAIARQLDALGVRAVRVYVNGIAAHTTDESSHEPADPSQPSRLMATPSMPPRQIPPRLQEK